MTHPHPLDGAPYDTGAKMALANGRTIDLADLETIRAALDLACWARGMCSLARWRGQTPELWLVAQHSALCAYMALELYKRSVSTDQWDLHTIWAILWCGVLHDCEEALIGDPPRGLGAVPELGPLFSAYKRRVRMVVADTLCLELGVDPIPRDPGEGDGVWDYIAMADRVYMIDLERHGCAPAPAGCATLNDADALAFKLAPKHAEALHWRDLASPWHVPFEHACHMLVTLMRNLAGLMDQVHATEPDPDLRAVRLMELAQRELETVFSAGILGDQRVALFERRDGQGQVWLVQDPGLPRGVGQGPRAPGVPEGWTAFGLDGAGEG